MKHKHLALVSVLVIFALLGSAWGIAQASGVPDETSEQEKLFLPFVLRFSLPSNHRPYMPSAPSPADGAIDQSIDATLSWTGGDPDGDVVTYDVYFEIGDDTPDVLVSSDQLTTTYDPGTLIDSSQYYWQVVAEDEHGAVTIGPVWNFTTLTPVNQPPNVPSAPSPADGAIDKSIESTLSWTGGDPDGDAVTYDVYFEPYDDTPDELVSDNQAATTYDPGTLEITTQYYWQIVAEDEHGLVTSGPVWTFTTGDIVPSERFLIPAGDFQMGCDGTNNAGFACTYNELPVHTVYLDAYLIEVNEVTNGLYAECVAAGECSVPKNLSSETRASYYGNPDFADYPVIYVDWYQAMDYCSWTGGRLPTEAQWEKAARGSSDTRPFPWGNALPTCSVANFAFDFQEFCVGDTTLVGSYPANASPYGILDMAGNVWEWVYDWFDDDYYKTSPASNPEGPSSGFFKVRRGGSWYDIDYALRVAERSDSSPTSYSNRIGFRCAYPVVR